jgi:hypothetical protein
VTPDLIGGSAFGDPKKEVPKALHFFGVFDDSYVGSPNALTMFARSRMTDNSASMYSNFFTSSEAETQVAYPLGLSSRLFQSAAGLWSGQDHLQV